MLIKILRRILGLTVNQKRKKGVTCGERTDIPGTIDIRSDGGQVKIGNDCLIEGFLVTEINDSRITIHDNVYVGGGSTIDCVVSVEIESDVLISHYCFIADSDNHSVRYSIRKRDLADWKLRKHDWSTTKSRPVRIGKGAWLGARSIILKGVTIGEGSVVGAGSVVTKDVPPWTVVAGNPAKVIREIPPDER